MEQQLTQDELEFLTDCVSIALNEGYNHAKITKENFLSLMNKLRVPERMLPRWAEWGGR